jgi:hypothetical protein
MTNVELIMKLEMTECFTVVSAFVIRHLLAIFPVPDADSD